MISKNELMIKIKCDKNWILDSISPWNNSNPKRWKNYIAVVTRDDTGKFNYNWLEGSPEPDEWFNIKDVVKGDILMVGVKDYYHPNRPSNKMYYKVLGRTNNELVVVAGDTFRKAKEIEELEEE